MKKSKLLLLVFSVVFVASLSGCAQQPKSANSKEAIKQAMDLKSAEEQVKYLVSEANAFINSQQFDESISVAKYILSELDKNSAEAKSILEKAQAGLKDLAEKKAQEAKEALKKKMESLGK